MESKIMENTMYKILLVEDDKLDQMAFTRMVEHKELPYDCTVAGSVAQARDILKSERFDIVISDYSLGDGTAFDVMDLVKNTPVILVTGAGDEELAVTAWKAGVHDYLIKDHERNYLKAISKTVDNAVKYRKMEQRLKLLSHAIVSTEDCVYITDLDDKITFVNRAFCESYGYKEEEIVGQDCDILWKNNVPAERSEKNYRAVSGWEVGFFHYRKDGSQFPVSLTRSDVKDENGKEVALVVISRDISERMEIESELRTANRDLEERNRLRKELAVSVCHELTALLSEVQNIISDANAGSMGTISDSLKKNFERADKDINKAGDVLNNFIEMSQLDADNTGMEQDNKKFDKSCQP
jgi:PAS domain S-box-containing protein